MSSSSIATADATGNVSNPGANVANIDSVADWNGQDGNVTTVGSAGANNFYGTFDMNGNVTEWTDTSSSPITWGGRFSGGSFGLTNSNAPNASDVLGNDNIGFRVASVIPEPSSMLLSLVAGGMMLVRRKR